MATTEPVATEVPAAEGSAPMTSPNASLYVGELGKYYFKLTELYETR